MPPKDGFSKKDWGGIDLSCIIWKEDGIVFFPENMIFLEPKMKDDLSQEIHGSMIIFVYMYQCYKYGITLLQ